MAGFRIAILGAGPSGLSLLKELIEVKAISHPQLEIVGFEKQSDWGGIWNMTWHTGTDEYGEPVHASMYKNLTSNGPKECIEYPDFTFDDHFKQPIESFPRREVIREYIVARAEKSISREFIRFSTVIRHVGYDATNELFEVISHNLVSGKTCIDIFDYVVVATGHFSVPNLPSFEGLENFPGRILHSHDFRDASQFSGQDVLIIGSSSSGEDIALQLYKFGARSISISYRTKPMGFDWPPEIVEVPLLVRLDGSIAHFKDGQSKSVHSIILCTGYLHHFPFLADELRLIAANRPYPSLYKGVLLPNLPRLAFMGMQDLYFTLTLFEVQAWYIRDAFLGKLRVPDSEARAVDITQWQAREEALDSDLVACIDYRRPYSFPF